jgi:DNA (cytosine-5)-methyltransferase 1
MLLGHTTVCAVEIEPYCRKVLLQRQRDGILPKFPIWDDVCTFDGRPWRGRVDVVCGGFPCQDISAAGRGAGITGERSGLWKEFARIIGEIRPRYAFVENSPMLTSRGLGTILGDLAALGYDARWGVLGSQHTGAIHRRNRVWILAHTPSIHEQARFLHGFSTKAFEWHQDPQIRRGDFFLSKELDGIDPILSRWQKEFPAPGLVRVDDAVAHVVDRVNAVSNGQDPRVVEIAWKTLTQT